MTRRAICVISGFFLFVFAILGFLSHTYNKAIKEITAVGTDGIYIQWPIKNIDAPEYYPVFNFAIYYLHVTPTGVLVEGVIKQNALPLTATTSFVWNLKNLALADRCVSAFQFCDKPDESEIKELEVLLQEGRRRCRLHTRHEYVFPEVALLKPRSAI